MFTGCDGEKEIYMKTGMTKQLAYTLLTKVNQFKLWWPTVDISPKGFQSELCKICKDLKFAKVGNKSDLT